MGSIGTPEILLIFLVVLLVFGAKRIPEIARGLGKGIREFKDATREISKEIKVDDSPRIESPRPPVHATTPRAETPQVQPQEPARAADAE
jgi:sec-independent protein translocase protein TatA